MLAALSPSNEPRKKRSIIGVLVKIQKEFLFGIFSLLLLAMLFEMGARYFFKQSIFALSDYVGFTSVWLYAIGSSLATHDKAHIKAEFLSAILPSSKLRHINQLITTTISMGMSAVFTKWSFDLCLYSIEINEKTQAYPIPKVIFQSSFFIGGILMTIFFLIRAIESILSIKHGKSFSMSDTH